MAAAVLAGDAASLASMHDPLPDSVWQAFTTGTAADWRKQMNALPWLDHYRLGAAAAPPETFQAQLWPRLAQWHDFASEDPASPLPPAWGKGWQEHCAGRSLDLRSLHFIEQFMQDEATQGRFWWLRATSTPGLPGLSVAASANPAAEDSAKLGAANYTATLEIGSLRYETTARLLQKKWMQAEDLAVGSLEAALKLPLPKAAGDLRIRLVFNTRRM